MKITIYGIRNCDTMKKARAWLDANGVEHEFHDYKVTGIDRATLEKWAKVVGWDLYDDVGLLTPDVVDPASGYRRYRREQVRRARLILADIVADKAEVAAKVLGALRPEVVIGPDPTAVFFGDGYVNHVDHRTIGWTLLDAVAPAARKASTVWSMTSGSIRGQSDVIRTITSARRLRAATR